MSDRASVLVSAGDASGDQHAGSLVRVLRTRRPDVEVHALGGPALAAAGAQLLTPLAADPVMGFRRVIASLGHFMRLLSETERWMARQRPDVVILVDYPGFNVHLAALARRLGLPSVYYVCPQYWAWAPWRVRRFAKSVDEALVIFPFEVDFYRSHGVPVHWVGHPVADHIEKDAAVAPDAPPWRVALLPGSRSHEVQSHWQWLLSTAQRLRTRLGSEVVFSTTHQHEAQRQTLRAEARAVGLELEVRACGLPELLADTRLAIVCSGTATLECALCGVPSLVLYRVGKPSLLVSRFLVTSPFISQPNLLAGRAVFPEFLRASDPSEELADAALKLLADGPERSRCRRELDALRSVHLEPGAAERAADHVLAHLPAPPSTDPT